MLLIVLLICIIDLYQI